MATHAAFLRGMNVGGHRITNDELRATFAAIGFADVGVFRASGNVAFDAGNATDAEVTEQIEQGLEAELGYAVPTFVRTADELRAMAAEEPFPPEALDAAKGKLQVDLLRGRPGKKDRDAVLALATEADGLAFGAGAHLYWLPSGGTLESELDFKEIEKRCGLATRRTKGTIEQIAKKFFAG
jgi:uncharacterized protein (DUF1697 family)